MAVECKSGFQDDDDGMCVHNEKVINYSFYSRC